MSQTGSSGVNKVMISSTALDLPEHRKLVQDACLRQGMFPIMMEHLPASDTEALAESLRMVNEADIYLGIFAFRYGHIPKGYDISISEMEYNRALERGIPCLLFLMHEKHPITIADVERGEGAARLEALKARQKTDRVVNFFKSPEELYAQVINSLSYYRQPDLTAFHYVRSIPTPPEAYIAHPYTLLQTSALIGRQMELNQLTDWVATASSELYDARILTVEAMGGVGKSALTWKWFQDVAPLEMQPLAGRLWWSFYESDASFENFVIRALTYVSCRTIEDIEKVSLPEREEQLLATLDREPYLLVLDGLERLLIAYARMDAARLPDDDLDEHTANVVAGASGLSKTETKSFLEKHRLRKTADLRVGAFLRKLSFVRASRILISTRLYPADLQTDAGRVRSRCDLIRLRGLSDDDAISLWRAFGISGSRETLLPLFHTVDNHPLFIQVLAGEIAHDRQAPRDFDLWRLNHPSFDPFRLPLVQVRSHVLDFALNSLDETSHRVLSTIAAFHMPASYDTLVALFVQESKLCKSETALIAILSELEDRGLLGWDQRANRYDLHPIVRGVTWAALDSHTQYKIYQVLSKHFEPLSVLQRDDWHKIERLEDLTPVIELYNIFIGLKQYDEANTLFYERLSRALFYRLNASRQCVELLSMLFPDGLDQLPHLTKTDAQAYVLNALAQSLRASGQLRQAEALYRRSLTMRSFAIRKNKDELQEMGIVLENLSDTLLFSGASYEAEFAARQALGFLRQTYQQRDEQVHEAYALSSLGLALAARCKKVESEQATNRSISLAMRSGAYIRYDYQAQCALWFGEYGKARLQAQLAIDFCRRKRFERGMIRAMRLQGEVALGMDERVVADERLHDSLMAARKVNLIEEELPALIGLAELRRRQGDLKAARELLDDVWEPAERGPFKLFHADAYNVLARIEHSVGDKTAAGNAATKAYQLSWCDGPPFAYHWGLQQAKAHLAALNIQEPELPRFDALKHERMPQVEIEQ